MLYVESTAGSPHTPHSADFSNTFEQQPSCLPAAKLKSLKVAAVTTA